MDHAYRNMECLNIKNWKKLSEDEKFDKIIKALTEKKILVVDGKLAIDSKEFVSFDFIVNNLEVFNRIFHEWHMY